MEILKDYAGKGKARTAIEISVKTQATIVCMDTARVKDIMSRAQKSKLDIPIPITFEEFKEGIKKELCNLHGKNMKNIEKEINNH